MDKRNTSGAKGVRYCEDTATKKRVKRWQARIKVNGKERFVGRFLTKEEAVAAYAKAAKEYFGEFARTA